jgi:glycosyltransferase involved in cell wall biosynthesis
MQLLTLATQATLPQARVLAESLRGHQPDWPHEIVLVGREQDLGSLADSLNVRSAYDKLDVDVDRLIARHRESELTALLVPLLLRTHTEEHEGPVVHLPPSVWVHAPLDPLASELAARSVLLAPRLAVDVPDDGLEPTLDQMDAAGRISDSIMGVDGTTHADGFLSWWLRQLEATLGSLDGTEAGARPEDRAWVVRLLELAPARFSTAVLDDPGCNLSRWNLHEHTLDAAPEGVLVDGRWPLRFLDLAGFEPDRPHRLSAHASRVRVSRSPVLRELCAAYAQELVRAGWQNPRADVGRRLANGLVYDNALHELRETAIALGERFGDVFGEEGAAAFTRWLEGPAPEGGAHGISRYVFYRVAWERADVMRAYPDLDGPDGREYVAWCWAFGRTEMGIPDRFMPREPGKELPGEDDAAAADAPARRTNRTERGTNPARPPAGAGERAQPASAGPGSNLAVRVSGYLGHALGLGAAGRGYAQALRAVGVTTSAASFPLPHLKLPPELDSDYGRAAFEDILHDGRHGFEIVAVNADQLPDFVGQVGEDYFQGPRIGVWAWETNSIPERWATAYQLVDEIWVYSRYVAENIGAHAPVPVFPLPPPVQPPSEPTQPQRLDVPEDRFLFLFVFDYLSTIERKNPVGLIEAFKRAFAPEDGALLLIKTMNAPLLPLAEEEVLWAAHGRRDIHLIDRSLSRLQRDSLMAACDCYVSLHRAEGFGLTMAEAMAIGKPVIATGYSGNVDFMNAENSYLVDYEIGLVGPDCLIYPADGEWAYPSIEHAAELMRRVRAEPEQARQIGERARADIARLLSPAATGAAMRARLEALADASRSGGGRLRDAVSS